MTAALVTEVRARLLAVDPSMRVASGRPPTGWNAAEQGHVVVTSTSTTPALPGDGQVLERSVLLLIDVFEPTGDAGALGEQVLAALDGQPLPTSARRGRVEAATRLVEPETDLDHLALSVRYARRV